MRERHIPRIIVSHLLGILIFLLIIVVLNRFVSTDNMLVNDIMVFLNNNIALIVVMSIIFMIADIVYALTMPLSLPAPLFSAIASVLVVMFAYRIFGLLDVLLNTDIMSVLMWTRWIVYPLVFVTVLITGFFSVLFRPLVWAGKTIHEKSEKIIDIKTKKNKSWHDVGDEFKEMLYDLFHSWRKSLKK